MSFQFTYRGLHSGRRAWWFGTLAVWSAVATAGEVSSASNERLVDQLGVLQDALGQVAESVGVTAPTALTLPIGAAPRSSGQGANVASEKTSAAPPAEGKAQGSAVTNNTNAAAAATRNPGVGELSAAAPTMGAYVDASDLAGGQPALAMPNAGNLGNFDQVVGTLQPLSGDNAFAAAFKAPSGFGSGSIVMPTTAQGALSRGMERDSIPALSNSKANRAVFGEVPQFTIGNGRLRNVGGNDGPDGKGADLADTDSNKKDVVKDPADDNKSNLSTEEFDKKAADLATKNPLNREDYDAFRDLIAENPRRAEQRAKQDQTFDSQLQLAFDMFSESDRLSKTQDAKKDYKSLVDRRRQRSAIDDFQVSTAPVEGRAQGSASSDDGSTDRLNIERNLRPTGPGTNH